ncbi:metal-dependent hydrolase [Candidatus Nanohalococcus occultus]|uniref:Membrane protein n=1 Tax=Candidatus Nanohalococcus occultus TaxID=2978047 RepID=A0ABY8CEH2_9ARCH|nr:putative membrane protein [Candidatus Nanohaloarchaeota archaeon SVXNc]
MIVGHFFLAFTLAALVALKAGLDVGKALAIAFTAAAFSIVPDIDIVYALTAVSMFMEGTSVFVETFWKSSSQIHRGITHSLITGIIGAATSTLCFKTKNLDLEIFTVFTSFAVGITLGGFVTGFVLVLYVFSALFLARFTSDRLTVKWFFIAAFIGLISHPFGDLFTGTPPRFFYPLSLNFLTERIVLIGQPVLNLLAVFFIELSTVIAAVFCFGYLKGFSFRDQLDGKILFSCFFGLTAFLIQAPTHESSYQFVYSLVGFSLLGSGTATSLSGRTGVERNYFFAVNLVSAAALASISYLAAYLLL